MNSNKTVQEVLEREGVLVTEQELMRAARSKQRLNGVVPAQVENPAESNGAVASPMPSRHPDPSNGPPQGPQHGGIAKALREAYWVFDGDAKVRSQGLQTVGRVVRAETREHSDGEGGVWKTHHVTYDYQVDARRHSHEKQVGHLGSLKPGVPIRVYYLPDTDPLASALDPKPRTLAEREVRSLEPSPERAEGGSAKITIGS